MKKLISILLFFLFFSVELFPQSLPPNAILKDYKPFPTPRTNGRPGEIYRIDENGKKFIVQDVVSIREKISDEGDLIGRMYFTSEELLSLLNLEFDRIDIIPCEVKILKAFREYTEQTAVDKVLYDDEKIRELLVDENSNYFIIREAIKTKDITFRFSHEIVKKIKRGSTSLTKIDAKEEVDFPFEIRKKFKKEKRVFFLEQQLQVDPYDL